MYIMTTATKLCILANLYILLDKSGSNLYKAHELGPVAFKPSTKAFQTVKGQKDYSL